MSTNIQHAAFPHFTPYEVQLRFLLEYAVLAPSNRNSQPWLWQIEGDEVVLRADYSRAMPALDPQGRELIMSCGAALQHLCLAIRAFGYAALVQVLPDRTHPDVLARVRLSTQRPPTPDDERLFSFITKRHTHRGQFEESPLPLELLHTLQEECEREGVALHFAQEHEEQSALIELIERGDLIQNRNPAMRREIAQWIVPTGQRNDGIPTSALGIGDFMSHLMPIVNRLLDRGEAIAQQDKKLAANAPVLAIMSTADDSPQAWMAAGQALGRVLLRARSEGVWASFFSQPIQVNSGWLELRHMIGVYHFPQLVFRLGYAQPVPATPRRSVDEVTTVITSEQVLESIS